MFAIKNIMKIYKTIPDFPNYKACSDGTIFSVKNNITLKQSKSKHGYSTITPCRDGKVYTRLVHRLIASVFIPNPDNKPQVNHKNGIKNDNRVENLEWCTVSENQKHAVVNYLRTTIGEKNSQSKLSNEDVLFIFNYKGDRKLILEKYKISSATVSDIKYGRSWTHITGQIPIRKSKTIRI